MIKKSIRRNTGPVSGATLTLACQYPGSYRDAPLYVLYHFVLKFLTLPVPPLTSSNRPIGITGGFEIAPYADVKKADTTVLRM